MRKRARPDTGKYGRAGGVRQRTIFPMRAYRRSAGRTSAAIEWRLPASLDFDATVEHVARAPLPDLADWCVAFTPADGDVRMPRMVVAHTNPAKEGLLRAAWQGRSVSLPRSHPLLAAVSSRKPVVRGVCSPDDLKTLSLTDSDDDVLRAAGLHSLVVLPMVAHGLVVGALMLVAATSRHGQFEGAALESATAVASWSAQAIYNAQLFWEARLAARMREQVVAAGSLELMCLATNMEQRVSDLRIHVAKTGAAASGEALHRGLAHIENVAIAMGRRIEDLRLLASDPRHL